MAAAVSLLFMLSVSLLVGRRMLVEYVGGSKMSETLDGEATGEELEREVEEMGEGGAASEKTSS